MGSTAKGQLSGFLCRLCSKMSRFVVLIYGVDGIKLDLERKINTYLPVQISRKDPLPKTICLQCLEKIQFHHEMAETFRRNAMYLESCRTNECSN